MTTPTKSWDSASHLKSKEDIAEYLDAALEASLEDPAFLTHALGVVAKAEGMGKLAKAAGVSREGLYKSLSENGNPSFATIQRVTHALGLQLTISHRDSPNRPADRA